MVRTAEYCINAAGNSTRPCPECQGAGTWVACPHDGCCPCRGYEVTCEACDGTGEALCLRCGGPIALDVDGYLEDGCRRCDADDSFPLTHPE